MRTILPALLAATLLLSSAAISAQQAPLPTVPSVDLDRYAGTWHEIARYPSRFEQMCVREVTANYARNPDGTIAVVNSCRQEDGTMTRADGVARVVAPAKLEVRFAPAWLGFLPFVWGDYWVIDLAPDYSYSVVGAPARDYLWILARAPQLDDATMAAIAAKLTALGFDPARLVKSPAS